MAYDNNGNVIVPTSGCGMSPLPGVAVFNPEVTCPGAGYGASTFASPATPLGLGLTTPIARFTFASATAARSVFFGNLTDHCLEIVGDELGVTLLNACADGVATLNGQAEILCCFWESNQASIVGLVAKSSGDLDSLSATQILFQPCNPCFTSDTDFICTNGCNNNSNFILTNAVVGANAGVVVTIPASTPLIIEVCSCAPQVNSFATCPLPLPAVAQIAPGVACPPSVDYATSQVGYPNGAQVYSGQRRF